MNDCSALGKGKGNNILFYYAQIKLGNTNVLFIYLFKNIYAPTFQTKQAQGGVHQKTEQAMQHITNQ